MLHLTHSPGPPLSEFVECFWLLAGAQTPRKERILPSGTIELVVNLREDEMRIHDPARPDRYKRFSGAILSGTYSRVFICDALQHESIVGVHFKSRSVAFYSQQLGFKLDQKNLPAFAQVSIGNFKLILSGPGASGSRPMPDGRKQEPGGWNRVILQVADLPARIEALKKAGLHFRNQLQKLGNFDAKTSNWVKTRSNRT